MVIIPVNFGVLSEDSPKKLKLIYDPANALARGGVSGFIDKYLTEVNFQLLKAAPIFNIEEEKTNARTLTYFDFVMIGLLGMALMNSSIQGVSILMSKYREDKILKRITTTPLPAWKFILSQVLSRLVLNVIQISLILLLGIYAFGGHVYGNIFFLYLFALLGAILFQSIGFTVASLSRTTQAAEGMSTAIAVPMMFLSGVFFPIDQLPVWLSAVVQYLPLAPLLKMIRTLALEDASPFNNPTNIIIVVSWIVLMLTTAAFKFRMKDE